MRRTLPREIPFPIIPGPNRCESVTSVDVPTCGVMGTSSPYQKKNPGLLGRGAGFSHTLSHTD